MADIKLRSLKGSPLTHEEVDSNFRQFINSASLSPDGNTLSLFTSASEGSILDIPLGPAKGSEYSLQFKSGSAISGSGNLTYNPITSTMILTGSILVDGTIVAQQFHTQYVSSSIIFESGSTLFGNTLDDTHNFTGSLHVTGSTRLIGGITVNGPSSFESVDISGPVNVTEPITSPEFIGDLNGNATTATSASHAINADTASYVDYSNVANHPSYGDVDVSHFLGGNINTSLIPDTDVTYDLGSPSFRWRDLYLSQATIYLGEKALTIDNNSKLLIDGAEFAPKTAATASRVLWANVQGRPTVHDNAIEIRPGSGLISGQGGTVANTFTTNNPEGKVIELHLDTDSQHFVDAVRNTQVSSAVNAISASTVPYSGLTGQVPTWNQNTTGNAATANTASYIDASNVNGKVASANQADRASDADNAVTSSYAFNALSSSYAANALTASYAISASFEITKEVTSSYADTAGTVPYSGLTGTIPTWNQDTTGTAANALTASYIDYSKVDNTPRIPVDISELTDENQLLVFPTVVPTASYIEYSSVNNVPTIPSDISDLTDVNSLLVDPDTVATASYIDYSNVDNTPSIPSDISELTDNNRLLEHPTTVPTASYVDYSNVANTPTTIATASYVDYSNVDNTPTIPADISDLTDINGVLVHPSTDTGSLLTTASFSSNTITFTKGDASTFNLDLSTLAANTVDTASYVQGANVDGAVFSAVTAASATTASFALTASYLETTFVSQESDPIFTAHTASSITSEQITNWDEAHRWGNHRDAGYLTSFTESDPIFTAHTASSITSTQIENWDTAAGYGDHSQQGYLTSETLTSIRLEANRLEYVDEAGETTSIDLSLYLDDTNLARLTSGTFDAETGLATFTRDDNTTFSLDLSSALTTETDTLATVTARGNTTAELITFENDTDATNSRDGAVTIAGGLGVGKTLHVGGDIVAYSSSDKRLKDNIKPISSPIEKLMQIGGYEFDWNANQTTHSGHDIGVIAQEIENILPEIVTTRENGFKAVQYEKLVALLIEVVKDQQTQINELKEKL